MSIQGVGLGYYLPAGADRGWALIYMSYRGVRHAPAEVAAQPARDERVDPAQYYFRTAPFLETAASRYAWLNSIVAVGVGERLPGGVTYEVFETL